MTDAIAASRSLLIRAANRRQWKPLSLVLAAAASRSTAAEDGVGIAAMARVIDPSLHFLLLAAAATQVKTPDLNELTRAGQAVPTSDRIDVLAGAERFLARIDPVWTWAAIIALGGEADVFAHGALGLNVAAWADRDGNGPAVLPGPWRKAELGPIGVFARQLRADVIARAAVRGDLDRDDPRLDPLRDDPPGNWLLPWEASSFALAAVAIDRAWGLSVVDGLLLTHTPEDMAGAIDLVASGAVDAGLENHIVERVIGSRFATTGAVWMRAAAAAGVFAGTELTRTVDTLADRADDQIDDDGELAIVRLALLEALATGGAGVACLDRMSRWDVPIWLLIDRFIMLSPSVAATIVADPAIRQVIEGVVGNSSYDMDEAVDWWLDAGSEPGDRLDACVDALTVASDRPWTPVPGSLADIVHWPGD